jgi:regulatory protein
MTTGWRAKPKKKSSDRDPGPCPTKDALHEAALAYLARGAATAATLTRVLERRTATWARRAGRTVEPEAIAANLTVAHEAIARIVARFREVGLVNDATYAEARVRSLTRAGRSRRAIAAHLAVKGVDADTVRSALPHDANVELAAALTFARKRRLGPYAREEEDQDRAAKQKALAAMARAGFGWSVCERALGMDREQADERIEATSRG